jgi:hypothetical protein
MPISPVTLHQMYLAYFGRPGDADGLQYYQAEGWDNYSVTAGFSASPESQALYGTGEFGEEQIHLIYQNLFNRQAEPDGLNYWMGRIRSGELTPAYAAFGILSGAKNEDAICVQNKMTVILAFFEAMNTEAEKDGYNGPTSIAAVRAYLATVDETTKSLNDAMTALPQAVAQATGVLPVVSAFTTNIDNVVGTAVDNVYDVSCGNAGSVFNAGDVLDGKEGEDSLFVDVVAAVDLFPGVQTLNVEEVYITNRSGTRVVVDASNFAGPLLLGTSDVNDGVWFHNMAREHTASLYTSGAGEETRFIYADGVDVAKLEVRTDFDATLVLGGDDVESSTVTLHRYDDAALRLETLRLQGNQHAQTTLVATGGGTAIRQLTVEGSAMEVLITGESSGAFHIGTLAGEIAQVDARGYAGSLSIDAVDGFDVMGTVHPDTVTVEGSGSLRLGRGGDHVVLGATGSHSSEFIVYGKDSSASGVQGEKFSVTTSFDPSVADVITGIDSAHAHGSGLGTRLFLTSAIGPSGVIYHSDELTFGTTRVAAVGSYFVLLDAATFSAFVFIDSGGVINGGVRGPNGVIDHDDTMIRLVGNSAFSINEFEVVNDSIVFTSEADAA